jgi:hypothetical protein
MAATSSKKAAPELLYSLNTLCRRLDVTCAKGLQLLSQQILVPDFVAANSYLFRAKRLNDLAAAIQSAR